MSIDFPMFCSNLLSFHFIMLKFIEKLCRDLPLTKFIGDYPASRWFGQDVVSETVAGV